MPLLQAFDEMEIRQRPAIVVDVRRAVRREDDVRQAADTGGVGRTQRPPDHLPATFARSSPNQLTTT